MDNLQKAPHNEHGSFKIYASGNIVNFKVSGAWNNETAKNAVTSFYETASRLILKP